MRLSRRRPASGPEIPTAIVASLRDNGVEGTAFSRKKLHALAFLVQHMRQGEIYVKPDVDLGYTFAIYPHGPVSLGLHEDLLEAVRAGLLTERRVGDGDLEPVGARGPFVYEVTRAGLLAIEALPPRVLDKIGDVARRFGDMSPWEITGRILAMIGVVDRRLLISGPMLSALLEAVRR